MTDTKTRTDWHSISEGPDAELAELRRLLADAELRAIKATQSEDVAQFAFETAKRRADNAEGYLRRVLIEHVVEPATEVLDDYSDKVHSKDVPDGLLDDIAGDLIDDLDGGGTVDGLHEVARRRLNDWAEGQ
jgi:hypothetical protein